MLHKVLREVVRRHREAGHTAPPVLALPEGSWAFYDSLAAKLGFTVVRYPVVDSGAEHPLGVPRFTYDVDALLALHTRTPVAAALIPAIENPTGATFPLDRIAEVATALRSAAVLFDAAYLGFTRHFDMTALPGYTRDHPNVVLALTMSKLWGLAGKRIGAGVAGEDFADLAEVPYLGLDRTDELVGLAALRDVEHYAQVRADIIADREVLYRTLPLLGLTVWESAGNFVLVEPAPDAVDVVRAALGEAGISIKWLTGVHAGRARVTVDRPAATRAFLRALSDALLTVDSPEHTRELLRVLSAPLPETSSWSGPGHGPAAARFAAATSNGRP